MRYLPDFSARFNLWVIGLKTSGGFALLDGAGHKKEAVHFIRTQFSGEEEKEWRRWSNTGYYSTYPELFHATGLRRTQGSLLRQVARKIGLGRLKSRLTGR